MADSTVQALGQRLGAKAEAQTQARLKEPPPLAMVMVDGFQVRFRGPGWGQRKPEQPTWNGMKPS